MLVNYVLEQYFSGRHVIEKIDDQEYLFVEHRSTCENNDPVDDLYVLSAFDPLLLGYEKMPEECIKRMEKILEDATGIQEIITDFCNCSVQR